MLPADVVRKYPIRSTIQAARCHPQRYPSLGVFLHQSSQTTSSWNIIFTVHVVIVFRDCNFGAEEQIKACFFLEFYLHSGIVKRLPATYTRSLFPSIPIITIRLLTVFLHLMYSLGILVHMYFTIDSFASLQLSRWMDNVQVICVANQLCRLLVPRKETWIISINIRWWTL